jgi:hypothetical protein
MLLLLALLLQTDAGQQARDVTTLEHVRRNLDRNPALLSAPPPDMPTFRVSVIERHILFERPWEDDDGIVPPYVRPWARFSHHEFLSAVTPEAFRSATLYPVGVPVMPTLYAAQKAIARSIRAHKQQRAREAVRRELEQFLANNR